MHFVALSQNWRLIQKLKPFVKISTKHECKYQIQRPQTKYNFTENMINRFILAYFKNYFVRYSCALVLFLISYNIWITQ